MKKIILPLCLFILGCSIDDDQMACVVLQTDFGVKDGAVAAMKGVANEIDRELEVVDLTHEIPAYNIWEAGYRLSQVVPYWPENTVFVSVVDPGVGTSRRSIVARTKKGHYIVTPDNGTITLVAGLEGIDAVRTIDESVNRRKGSDSSYTFHGRDVYMYTAARLASRKISFEEVGPASGAAIQLINYQQPQNVNGSLRGNIPVLDPQYGNIWTNIPAQMISQMGIKPGDSLSVMISLQDSMVYSGRVVFANTFGDVSEGKPLAYLNSLLNFSLAVNRGNFAEQFQIGSGPDWTLEIKQ